MRVRPNRGQRCNQTMDNARASKSWSMDGVTHTHGSARQAKSAGALDAMVGGELGDDDILSLIGQL